MCPKPLRSGPDNTAPRLGVKHGSPRAPRGCLSPARSCVLLPPRRTYKPSSSLTPSRQPGALLPAPSSAHTPGTPCTRALLSVTVTLPHGRLHWGSLHRGPRASTCGDTLSDAVSCVLTLAPCLCVFHTEMRRSLRKESHLAFLYPA